MTLPQALSESLERALGSPALHAKRVSGGDINDAWRLELEDARSVFLKSRSSARPADFVAEAAGLRWLSEPGALRVPEVLGAGDDQPWLALEWIEPGSLSAEGSEQLGSGLAAIHRAGADAAGRLPPGSPDDVLRIGSVEIELAPTGSWAELYAGQILLPLVRQARDRGNLEPGSASSVEAVCERMDELCGPPEPPARSHGDLWGGNVMADGAGTPVLIDPASYAGHREMDLAMLRLFGGPPASTFAAYEEAFPLADGHAERVELWQLAPLLVHAILFGGSYGESAGRAAARYR